MKKIITITILILCACGLLGQATQKSKVKEDHRWGEITAGQMAFYMHSPDRKERNFYIKVDDMFAPVRPSSEYSLGTQYNLPKSKSLILYKRNLVEGIETFTPELTIDTEGFDDFVVGIYRHNGSLDYRIIDISVENMPIGSVTVSNMQPVQLGLNTKTKKGTLGFYKKFTEYPKDSGKYVSAYVEIYTMKNPQKPGLIWPGSFRFKSDERLIAFVFGAVVNESPYPNESDNQIYMYSDKGPRAK